MYVCEGKGEPVLSMLLELLLCLELALLGVEKYRFLFFVVW